jgi:hypothetical protein
MKPIQNHLQSIFLGGALLFGASASVAEADFDRIHKDVTVMTNIIKGAFEADENCRGCKPRIEATYLANQGAVFAIRVNAWRSFSFIEDSDSEFSFVIPAPEEVREIEITEVVGDVLDSLGTVVEDVGSRIEFRMQDLEHDESFMRIDSEARRALRELQRERRDLEYERREYEIELIHADESSRKNIEKQIAKLEKQVSAVEQKRAELNEVYEAERKEREAERQAKREKARQAAEQQLAAIENVVIRSLCDYGGTLKNIPEDEFVSLQFERGGEQKTKIFVMEMGDVQGCRQADVLRSDALIYKF